MLVSAWLPGHAAAQEDPRKAGLGPHPLPHASFSSTVQRENDLLLLRNPTLQADAALVAYQGASALLTNARTISADFALVPAGNSLLTAHFLGDDLDTLSKGLGVDMLLPGVGYFHMNLYSGKDGPNLGRRWQLNPSGFSLPQSANRFWSLGASLDVEKVSPTGKRSLVFVPQLVMNLDAVVPMSGRLQAIVSYHNWHSNAGVAQPDVGQVPQVSLKWSF
ncbi:MAG: hypothetical protein JOY51_08465 [Nevskia sp.]|nr:hypothetical protein [Nevskia sp.]